MVSKPNPWMIDNEQKFIEARVAPQMVDLVGGYYTTSKKASMFINRYRMLSTREYEHFHIRFLTLDSCKHMCNVVTLLQNESFQINSKFLSFLKENQDFLVQKGLLMPPFLANVISSDMYDLIRKELLEDNQKVKFKYDTLVGIMDKRIQRARYEQFLLELATVYEGYTLYFPAFLDFRGRFYRTGILHFHERDLARSLLLFSGVQDRDFRLTKKEEAELRTTLWWSGGAHYKSFGSMSDFYKWVDSFEKSIIYYKALEDLSTFNNRIIEYVLNAKSPFQFLSRIVHMDTPIQDQLTMIPLSKDASSSAYQIMLGFLLDQKLAENTNLLKLDSSDRVYDLYDELLLVIKHQLVFSNLDPSIQYALEILLNRKLLKKIFMPIE
jgi:DNA-directed RNA polymerase